MLVRLQNALVKCKYTITDLLRIIMWSLEPFIFCQMWRSIMNPSWYLSWKLMKSALISVDIFSLNERDLLNVQGSMFSWRVHHMSDKSHALEMEFTEMKSRVTACSFLYYRSKNQRILQKHVSARVTEYRYAYWKVARWRLPKILNSVWISWLFFRFYPH